LRIAHRDVGEAAEESFGAEGDARERVIDLVSDARGEEADADQALRAHQLPAAFVDLPDKVGMRRLDAGGHVVEGVGKLLKLVAGSQGDRMVELTRGDVAHTQLQPADRVKDPAVEEVEHPGGEYHRGAGASDDDKHAAALVRLGDRDTV